jgi:predicted amidophosphoribosyltransferase
MAKVMCTTGKNVIKDSDVIIPIPIHFTRMLKRKYNQASLLSKLIAKQMDKEVLYSTLLRKVATKSQGHLSIKERKSK